jgi:hypothetical protein
MDIRMPVLAAAAALAGLLGSGGTTTADQPEANHLTFKDSAGQQTTVSTAGAIDASNPFFQDLGTNGRSCFTCHRPSEAWSMTPVELRHRFDDTAGLDPVFRNNDGSNCEGADLSSLRKRRKAFSQLLSKGLIRVGLPVPADAEFSIVDVDDPYGCGAPFDAASLYRRPLPSTNLGFLSAVMWDGRETGKGLSIRADLLSQALDATTGHAQGAPPLPSQLEAIVDFELGLFTAQTRVHEAGSLARHGATGGPDALVGQPFCVGINDPLNMLPAMPGACAAPSGGLDPDVFTLFGAWKHGDSPERQAIARGEQLFNTRTFVVDGVAGLNGGSGDPIAGPMTATCTLCHDTPNAGGHSVSMPLDIGVAAASRRTADLPLYTLENKTTHHVVQVTDPGRAMITGKWADIAKFKGPTLRALSARAPYFHNGSAATLGEVLDFYEQRFNLQLSHRERADLLAFLSAL